MSLVREPVFRGVRAVDGLLFDGPQRARQALHAWRAGATLLPVNGDRLVLRWRDPVWMRCEIGNAAPVIDAGEDRLVALPLAASDAQDLPPESVTSLRGGLLVTEPLGAPLDPISLLDLRDWQTANLSRAPLQARRSRVPEPKPPPLAAPPRAFNSRSELAGGGEPTRRERREWDRLHRPQAQAPAAQGRSGSAASQRRGALDWLYRRRHERYLSELTRLFAAGQYEEALRRAIPFGGQGGRLARSGPRPRRDLKVEPWRSPSSSAVPIEAGLRAELQTRYRAAFNRLEAEGRVGEAAFVLAELLDQTSEACSFLERHGEIRLAAGLAEARSHDPADAVRLWWRAGERHRAVALARQRGCFAPAIMRLERSGQHDEASSLRRMWVTQLLDAGDIVAAYDACGALDDELDPGLRRRLIDLGVAQGGPLRALMLARQLRVRDDDPHPELLRAIDDPGNGSELEIILTEVTRTTSPVDHPHVVRAIARRVIAERRAVDHQHLRRAIDLAEDPVLRTDLPPLDRFAPDSTDDVGTTWVEVDAADRGHLGVRDARVLPDGRIVAALSGIGLRVMRPSGKAEVDFDVPADDIIISDNGLRVLALRRVGEHVIAISSIALPERRTRHLGEIAATIWAQTFDGASWFLANHRQVWMLDMLPEGPTALWRQDLPAAAITGIARSATQLLIASALEVGPQDGSPMAAISRYALPSLQELDVFHRAYLPKGVLLPSGEMLEADDASETYRVRIERAEVEAHTVVATKVGVETPIAVVRLAAATTVGTRIDGDSLIVFDNLGRIEVIGLASGIRHSSRMTV